MKKEFQLFFVLLFILSGILQPVLATTGPVLIPVKTPVPVPVNCDVVDCDSSDQQLIDGYNMFDETNFDPVVDGFGRTRQFWVHIPVNYDAVDGVTEKIPVIFAFHGSSQEPEAMVDGKWGDYFDENVAFVIPRGEADPCDSTGPTTWMGPKTLDTTTSTDINCDPATQQTGPNGDVTYWNASITGTFADVEFVENLRTMVLDRFPKLNSNKVYATGFSAGGGITYTLLCYRSRLFRGFSVAAFTLVGDLQRGDYDEDGIDETDPNSLLATCGKNVLDAGHATGITGPQLWGYGNTFRIINVPLIPGGADSADSVVLEPLIPELTVVSTRVTKPIALFAGDKDSITPMDDINATGNEIRNRNNLNGTFYILNPFEDSQFDFATTQRRTFDFESDSSQPYSVFRRFLIQGVNFFSGGHAMPDAEECGAGLFFMTCDYSYTTQTKLFFEQHADLNLNP